ncbi:MAG: TonB-dependent receptor [Odoribacter sp.]
MFFLGLFISVCAVGSVWAEGNIKGTVVDKASKEPVIGAAVVIENTTIGAATDIDGKFIITGIKAGKYNLKISCISYAPVIVESVIVENNREIELRIEQEAESISIDEVTVKAVRRMNSEAAMINVAKTAPVVMNAVSSQMIGRTQDKDASEVIRRIPGISVIDGKFVMVRGLSQRYNNVWINNSAVPSSEPDSRAFSFDIIPASQLDNMQIVKSPAPEYPADFTGGFIQVNTKDIPDRNSFYCSVGGNINDQTHGRSFFEPKGGKLDFLGFDHNFRSLDGGIERPMAKYENTNRINLLANNLNNDWGIKKRRPLTNLSVNAALNRKWEDRNGSQYGFIATVNYSDAYRTFLNMENSLFGTYDEENDRSAYLRRSKDNQYSHDTRVGAMMNLTFVPNNSRSRYQFKNIFNQVGKDRYTSRTGVSAQNDEEESVEYYYSSRTTYNGQLTGTHEFETAKLNWNAGYAYANRSLPDRRRFLQSEAGSNQAGELKVGSNDISREFTRLHEHIISTGLNYQQNLSLGDFTPDLKAGVYAEYRTREYLTRSFFYGWDQSQTSLPNGFLYMGINDLLVPENYGADKLYLLEEVKKRNDYSGNNTLLAGYLGLNIPLGRLNVYAGVRYENNQMELISNTKDDVKSPRSLYYKGNDFFPSLNASYQFSDIHQLRFAYGRSVNRQEFREVSTSVYYDFDLASPVMGNTDLKAAYIQNLDLRYELYPGNGEQVTLALFYKKFNHPIEWTYTVSGGTDLTYSYLNALSADNYGIELDIRKSLEFIGLKNFSLTFNGSLIKSKVNFTKGSKEENRPMQGQSPYLINTGLFYQNETVGFGAGLLYNRIGKRIVGVGRSVGTTGGDETKNVPNSYEMPRNSLDISLSQKFCKRWEIRANVRDVLAEKVLFQQMAEVNKNGATRKHREITKEYKPGRNYGLSLSFTL